jgi:Zn-dependent M28 family amino/carboxypeptidase
LGLLLIPVPAIALLVVALAIISQNRVTDNSPGAVDNATALVAVFMTLDQLSENHAVGVVFPDAEEFGLVGARALAAERAALFADACVINLDGLDDAGRPIALLHKPGRIGTAIAAALGARRARWLPVIVDGIALAPAAAECCTILKGNWRTMRIVHRPEDSVARVRLDGAAAVAAGLARVLRAP